MRNSGWPHTSFARQMALSDATDFRNVRKLIELPNHPLLDKKARSV